jgi:hypothetical protein
LWVNILSQSGSEIALAVLLVYGPIVGPHEDHDGFRYLMAPPVCAILVALYFSLFSPNIYHGYSARAAGLSKLSEHDPDAQRFVALFRSTGARSFAWRAAARVALLEILFMAVPTLIFAITGTLTWAVSSTWLWQGVIGCLLGSFIAVGSDLFAWVMRRWVEGGVA